MRQPPLQHHPVLLRALLAIVAMLALPAFALAGTVSITPSTGTLSGDGGGTTTLTQSAPVAAPGTVSQSLTQAFDRSRLALTGATGIVGPTGWALTYSSDGVTFGAAPGSPAGWAAIRAVRATGSIQSGGDSAGFQIATGSGIGSLPPSGTFSSAGGGDGWDVGFDAAGHVFNTFHHDGSWSGSPGFSTPGIDCHTRTGGSCGPGWPFLLRIAHGVMGPGGLSGQPWYHTNDRSMQWVDTVNQRVWIPTTLADGTLASGSGFACVDISDLAVGPAWCGGNITDAFVKLAPAGGCASRDCTVGPQYVAGRLFALESSGGTLMCLDPSGTHGGGLPGAACASQPYALPGISSAPAASSTLGVVQGLLFGSSGTTAMCFDPDLLQPCAAWTPTGGTLTGAAQTVADVPAADGSPGSACFLGYPNPPTNFVGVNCFNADGTSTAAANGTPEAAGFVGYISAQSTSSIGPKNPETSGTRLYWADGKWFGGGSTYCWDTSLNAGAGGACSNFPVSASAYTVTVDAQNTNCIWTNTDSGQIATIDAVTGGGTCVTPPSAAAFDAPVLLPRLSCSGANAVRAWRRFDLTGPSAVTYSSARLTVLTATGRVVAGWNRVPITGVGRTVDLSSLQVSDTGQSPRFRVELAGKSTNDPIQGDLTAVGDAPQLCLPLQAQTACPAAPARVPGALPVPAATPVTGSGEATNGGSTDVFVPGTASIAFTPPADATCLGTVSGTATMQSGGTPIAGAHIRLLNPSGQEVGTTTTDPSGAYSFDRLVAGTGYRVEFGPTSSGAATQSTDASAATSRTITAATNTVVNGQYALLRTNRLSEPGPNNTPVTLTALPHDSTGAAGGGAFTGSATCLFDPADGVCKSSVTVPGEGTWTAGTGMDLVFTPLASFSGTATALRYRVTETATGDTTWNWAQAEVAAPIPPAPVTPPATQTSAPAPLPTSVPVSQSSTAVVTRITVPGAGRVTQTGTTTGPNAATPRVACTAAVTVRSAGTVTMRCAISSATRVLLRTRSVRVTVVTRFVGTDGVVAVSSRTVVLKRTARPRLAVTG